MLSVGKQLLSFNNLLVRQNECIVIFMHLGLIVVLTSGQSSFQCSKPREKEGMIELYNVHRHALKGLVIVQYVDMKSVLSCCTC